MPNGVVVTPEDLVHSFCKMMKQKGIKVSVIYQYQKGGREIMKMTGNQGPEGTQAMLAVIAAQTKAAVAKIEAEGSAAPAELEKKLD